jgi:Ca2+-transporting ATPase
VAEVLVLVLALALGLPTPFVAVQILWNNLVTEGTITASLAMEPREGNEMARPPIARDESIVTRALLRRIALMSVTITAVTLGFYLYALHHLANAEARTATFTLLAMCEWFNVLSCRSETLTVFSLSTLKNRWLWAGLLVSALLQTAVVFAPPLQGVFHTVPVSARVVLVLPLVASLVLWVEEIRKWLARVRSRSGDTGRTQLAPLSLGG